VVTISCSIHDFCYGWGPDTIKWKELSDRGLANNLLRQVELAAQNYSPILYPITRLRMKKVDIYHAFVHKYGGPSFWKGRNRASELSFVDCTV